MLADRLVKPVPDAEYTVVEELVSPPIANSNKQVDLKRKVTNLPSVRRHTVSKRYKNILKI